MFSYTGRDAFIAGIYSGDMYYIRYTLEVEITVYYLWLSLTVNERLLMRIRYPKRFCPAQPLYFECFNALNVTHFYSLFIFNELVTVPTLVWEWRHDCSPFEYMSMSFFC